MAKSDSRDIEELFFEEGNKASPHLKRLSRDLCEMFIKGEMTDFTLHTEDDENVRCHKAILAARSPALSRIIDTLGKEDSNSFRIGMKKPALKAMLDYIYSGDLSLIAFQDVPLLDLYIIAHDYELFAMKDFIAPEILPDKPPVSTNELLFIMKFDKAQSSRLFTKCESKHLCEKQTSVGPDKFYIGIRVKDDRPNKDYVSIYLRRETNREVIHKVLLDISILDIWGHRNFQRRLDYIFKTDGECEMAAYVKKEMIAEKKSVFLLDGNLTFSFTLQVRFYDSEKSARIFKIDRTKCSHMLMDAYRVLSIDLWRLFSSEKYSDIIISSHSASFTAHKCILAARSMTEIRLLKDVFYNLSLREAESFLLFLYTGNSKYLAEHAEKVHQLASGLIFYDNKRGVEKLKQFYFDYLSKTFTIENVLRRLTCSVFGKDASLRHSAIEFIYLHMRKILPSKKWTIFATRYLEVVPEFENYFNDKRNKSIEKYFSTTVYDRYI